MTSNGLAPTWTRRRNRFKELLEDGSRPPIAMWVSQPWPGTVEIMGAAGVDAAIIDLQHSSLGLTELEYLVTACEAVQVTPIVRVPRIDATEISKILDTGAQGILFPGVEDADQAKLAMSCLRYPPNGIRGWGGAHHRAAGYDGVGTREALTSDAPARQHRVQSEEYLDTAENVVALFLVETTLGVENIEEIAATPGVHGIGFGWGDFSVEVRYDKERAVRAEDAIYDACRKHGVGMSNVPAHKDYYPGCYFHAGVDSTIIGVAIREAAERTREKASQALRATETSVG